MPVKAIALTIIFVELASGVLLHSAGLYLLLTQRKKKIITLLLIHLSLVELIFLLILGINEVSLPYIISHIGLLPLKCSQLILICFLTAQFLSLAIITFERVLAVKLALRYRIVATKRKLIPVFSIIWLLSVSMSMAVWMNNDIFHIVLAIWEISLTIMYACSYSYIFITVRGRRRRLNLHNSAQNHLNLNLKVPFLLVFTLICFYCVPDLLLATKVCDKEIWFLPVFYVNYITDGLIYIFGLPECRQRIKRVCKR